jgi:hypothetical protein
MYRQGNIQPIHPRIIYEASDIQLAFRRFQQPEHMGKIIVQLPEDLSLLHHIPLAPPLVLDSGASYLIVGGFGGLGRAAITWMIQRGARNFVVITRKAGQSNKDREFIKDIESLGCSIGASPGNVERYEDLKTAISMATSQIKGVIHLAMVLRVSYAI